MRQSSEQRNGEADIRLPGKVGARIRQRDWSSSPLGKPARWPQSLKTALSILCGSSQPMLLFWGPELLQFHNDAYRACATRTAQLLELGVPFSDHLGCGPLTREQLERVSVLGAEEAECSGTFPAREGASARYLHVPIAGERGLTVGVLTTVVDPPDKAAQRELEARSGLHVLQPSLLMQSPLAICVVRGPEHRYAWANPSYLEMVNKQELIGKTMTEAFPEVAGTPLMDVFDRIYRTGEPFVAEEYVTALERGRGIEECIFRFNLVATRDAHGAVDGWMCTAVEISDTVRARRDAVAARSLLETLIEQMHAGLIVAEAPSGRTLFANRAVERILGRPPLPSLTLHNYRGYPAFHPSGEPYAPRDYPIARVLRGERMLDQEVQLLDGVGKRRTVCMSATPVHDASGRQVAAAVSFYDLTERKEAEQQRRALLVQAHEARAQAEQASRAKDEFMAILGHELRNPLAPITTALYLMDKNGDEKTRAERVLIQRQVDHLVRLVDDLLDASRVTGGKVRLHKRVLELSEVVERAIELTSPLIEERAHDFSAQVPALGLGVDGDFGRLAQVVANLLTNAAKYTPEGGRIVLDAHREGDEVVLSVRDNGIGIAPEILPHVFELFVQEPQALDRSRGGLGLGLSIAQSLVQLHGGVICAHSDGPGQGSAFVLRLPRASEPPRSTCNDPRPSLPPRVFAEPERSHRILVVDDNKDAATTLAHLLEGLGQQVRVAHDGTSALRLASEFAPELGLLDIGLPVMDGYELARRLRARSKPLRLVAVTGYGQASDRDRAFEAGFDAHVVKPLPVDALEAILADLGAESESAGRTRALT